MSVVERGSISTVIGAKIVSRQVVVLLAALVVATVALLTLPFLAPPASAYTLSGSPDRTLRTDGRISDILVVRNRIYLAGTFTRINGAPRARLAAIDATTGRLTPWKAGANGWVKSLAVSADGTKVYAGGDFTAVGGVPRARLVALDATTGAVDDRFNPGANATVNVLASLNGRLFAGGDFTSLGGEQRSRLAAVNGTTGVPLPGWKPSANATVRTLKFSTDKRRIYVGGYFGRVSGQPRRSLAALSSNTGAVLRWRPDSTRPVVDMAVTSEQIFTAEAGASGGSVAAYDARKGTKAWSLSGNGDAQAVASMRGKLYVGGHFTKLGGQSREFFAAVDLRSGKLDPKWAPRGAGGGVWTVAADLSRKRLYVGGDFTSINDKKRQRFARFSM